MASHPPSWLIKRFSTEERCRATIRELRWPGGFRCPGCGSDRADINARGLFRCQDCQKQTSEVSGTTLAGARIPLVTWFSVLWVMSETPSGISASALAKLPDPDDDDRNLVTYKTAWLLLQKIRRVMQQTPTEPSHGRVEVSVETLDVVELGQFGRQGKKAVQVLVVVKERADGTTGWAYVQKVPDHEPENLRGCLMQILERVKGEEVWSAPNSGFEWLWEAGYRHRSAMGVGLLGVSRVMEELRAWQVRTHWGEMSEKHLGAYLDEFAFRFNHRCRHSSSKEIFEDLVHRAITGAPRTFQDVTRGEA